MAKNEDIEDFWQALGRPSPFQQAVKAFVVEVPEKSMKFIDFCFEKFGVVWRAFMRPEPWIVLTVMGALVIGVICLIKVSNSDGRTDYCMIVEGNNRFSLVAHRPWSKDIIIDSSKVTSDDAAKLARDLHCPLLR